MSTINTYAALQAKVAEWLQNDASLVDPATCISLAEDRLNRLLNTPDQEARTALDASTDTVDLPADFYQVRNVYLDVSPRLRLEQSTLSALQDYYASNATGAPVAYAIWGYSMSIAPAPDAAYSVILTYKQAIPPLSDSNPTNWLLTKHSDLYLTAALAMAELRGWNDERLPMLKAWYDELLGEVNGVAQKARFGNGPLQMRATVTDSFSTTATSRGQADNNNQFLVDG